jgi:hypothetical protein
MKVSARLPAAAVLAAAAATRLYAAELDSEAVLEELQSMKARITELETQLKEAKQAKAAAERARREAEQARREAQAAPKQAEAAAARSGGPLARAEPPSQPREAPPTAADQEYLAQEEKPAKEESKDTLKIGGALWLNYAYRHWDQTDRDKGGDFALELFRLSVDGRKDKLGISAQYRWCSYMDVLHHGYFFYDFAPKWQGQLGITQAPFGILPYASHSYWFGLPYYFGLEDDYDIGDRAWPRRDRRVGAAVQHQLRVLLLS